VDLKETKLLEHATKVVEKISEHRIQKKIEISDMQFGFMKAKGTTDAISNVNQMQANFRDKRKKLHSGFANLEKAFLIWF